MDDRMRNLDLSEVQVDKICTYVKKKEARVRAVRQRGEAVSLEPRRSVRLRSSGRAYEACARLRRWSSERLLRLPDHGVASELEGRRRPPLRLVQLRADPPDT